MTADRLLRALVRLVLKAFFREVEVAGAEVGPRLLGVGSRLTREQLLQALVDPNARIAPGFHAPSPMPPMGALLTKREIRDVVEYLANNR